MYREIELVTKPIIVQVIESSLGVIYLSWDKEHPIFTFSVYYSTTEFDQKILLLEGLVSGENYYTNSEELEATGYSNILAADLVGLNLPYTPDEVVWFWMTATNSSTDIEGPFSQGYAIRFKGE